MNFQKSVTYLSVLTTICGCAATSQYAERMKSDLKVSFSQYVEAPETSPHSLVRFVSDGVIFVHPNSACISADNENAGFVIGGNPIWWSASGFQGQQRGIQEPLPENRTFAEVRVPSGSPLTVSYRMVGGRFACKMERTFTPESNSQYEVISQAFFSEQKCVMGVRQLTPDAAPISTTPAKICGH